jgi:phosphatidate cytidylyltransferase
MGQQIVLQLFVAVVVFLCIATVAGWAMRRKYGMTPAVENFLSRTYAWWVMVILLTIGLLAGKVTLLFLYGAASAIALYEFLVLTEVGRADRPSLIAAFLVILPVQFWLIWAGWYGLFAIFIPVYVFLTLPVLSLIRGSTAGFMVRVAEMQWGVMLAVYCLSHIPAVLLLSIDGFEGIQVLLIAFLVIVVQSSDVFQYLWGRLLGRRKLVPGISPSKTVEGLVGGVATACAIGVAFSWITPFSPLQALGFAFLICVMGVLGGLVMSALKRDRGVKDWGSLIPGHGGVLDRFDSLLFSAPIFFHLVRFFWSD